MLVLKKTLIRLIGALTLCGGLVAITILIIKNHIESGDQQLEACQLDPDKCLNRLMPENYDSILHDADEIIVNDQLNTKFFRKFKYHFDQRVSHTQELRDTNRELYQQYMGAEIHEPKVAGLVRPSEDYQLTSATLVAFLKDKEADQLIATMQQVEKTFNRKFHYPWTFISEKPFPAKFKKKVAQTTTSECQYVVLEGSQWEQPAHIDKAKQQEGYEYLKSKKIQYATQVSYHNMCRFYSGTFFHLQQLQKYKYYWRVEPGTSYYCDIDYDVFKFMEEHGKTYGFTLNIYDQPDTIRSLWDTTVDFLKEHPQYVNAEGSFDWLLQDLEHPDYNTITNGYSTCHFWSNFEIGDMDFFRGESYTKWFEHLDQAGGFYYERWGDAPVHSIGLGLFEDKAKIHWFRDIGYSHTPYSHCPTSNKCHGCEAGVFAEHHGDDKQNCMANWIKYSMTEKELDIY
ncbi:hypothetical protein DASC09_046270 [Saccharomycopsis crataegensis]|uniref:Mannosyltransferase KTR4 n=1 Tax=Saccharomycopsis crataegensis TaxID=43959 RepID=A0AAV5QR01_9ASCO|nr:hypothetical protein DASC09_046270 [Saccharomycopsis crataegensis]